MARHAGVEQLLRLLEPNDRLPDPEREISRAFYNLAMVLVANVPDDNAELTTALRKLLEGKDAAVRASLLARGAI